MAKLASKVYGDALFFLAKEENLMDEISAQLSETLETLEKNPDFGQLMNHPGIPVHEKVQVIHKLLDGQVLPEIIGFLQIVIEKGHFDQLDGMAAWYQSQVKEYKGIGVVYITTPKELNENQKKQMEEKILSTSKYKTLETHYALDPSLMGGAVIRMNDRVLDSSLKNQLERMSKELMHLQIGKKV